MKIFIWWLTQQDYDFIDLDCKPDSLPDTIWSEVHSRCGRGGRFRLWVPNDIKYQSMPDLPNETWDKFQLIIGADAGGIVIGEKDVLACKAISGTITDEYLNIQ